MADGRLFTDYRPRCDINFLPTTEPLNSYAYRQFLIANGNKLLTEHRVSAYNSAVCGPCMSPYDVGTMLPEQSRMTCDGQTCSVKLVNPQGVGLGREYGMQPEEAAARSQFLAQKQQEQARMATPGGNCCASDVDRADYYPVPGTLSARTLTGEQARAAVPSGAYPALR